MGTPNFDFSGSVVIVTGAGSGIGRGIAEGFIDAGATVVVTGRTTSKLEDTLRDAPEDRTAAIACDVADADQVDSLVEQTIERFGRLDVVVSNAGVYAPGQIDEIDRSDWEAMRGANVDGIFNVARASLPRLAESGGNFVAVSSVSGERGDWGQSAYNATKATVSNFARSLALDWGERGVRVNAVAPAFTITPVTEGMADDEEALEPFVNRIALGRPGRPEDIAPAVLFLASEAAQYVTGVVLPVDGGTMASTGQPHV